MDLRIKEKLKFFQYEVQCLILVKRIAQVLGYWKDNGVSVPNERLLYIG